MSMNWADIAKKNIPRTQSEPQAASSSEPQNMGQVSNSRRATLLAAAETKTKQIPAADVDCANVANLIYAKYSGKYAIAVAKIAGQIVVANAGEKDVSVSNAVEAVARENREYMGLRFISLAVLDAFAEIAKLEGERRGSIGCAEKKIFTQLAGRPSQLKALGVFCTPLEDKYASYIHYQGGGGSIIPMSICNSCKDCWDLVCSDEAKANAIQEAKEAKASAKREKKASNAKAAKEGGWQVQ